MNIISYITKFLALMIIVIILGGLGGWYYFVHRQIAATQSDDAARGGNTPSFANTSGSSYKNASGSVVDKSDTVVQKGNTLSPRLWRVANIPVAGFGFASSSAQLFFVEMSSGNILSANPATSATERLTNTLHPKTYEAQFAPDGSVILRSLEGDVIQTFSGSLATTTQSVDSTSTAKTLSGLFLARDISSIAVLPAHTLVYALQDPSGGSVIVQSDWSGGKQKKLLVSPLREWQVSTISDGTIVIAQKPADGMNGFTYTLSQSGALSPLVQDLPGLIFTSRKGGAQLYSTSNGSIALFTKATTAPVRLSIQTTADKCVWAPGAEMIAYCAVPQATLPADYLVRRAQGAIHTSDTWYKVDVTAGTAETFYTPSANVSLDVEKPAMDQDGTYIAFTNAIDKSLWMLRIAQ